MASWVNERPTTLAPSPGILSGFTPSSNGTSISAAVRLHAVNHKSPIEAGSSSGGYTPIWRAREAEVAMYISKNYEKSSICSTASRRLNIDFALKNTRV
ncbi:hypothetical protein PoMZ_02912 [Pyricularia oryzae]|uniref:Uncharacterized protein n=1 Tax=Pyricularia oryzae TaxID=318829 RepID=A0A4P7NC50_PYROR|nr:hypothetical protein PoMZ_02912 [Pyricularia oryzae]